YELRLYPNLNDVPATVMVGSNSHDTITRPMAVTNTTNWGVLAPSSSFVNADRVGGAAYSGDLIAYDSGAPSGPLGNASSGATAPYTDGNFYLDISDTWNISTGNGNIRVVTFRFRCATFQVRFDPVITKTNTQVLTLHQRISWARR